MLIPLKCRKGFKTGFRTVETIPVQSGSYQNQRREVELEERSPFGLFSIAWVMPFSEKLTFLIFPSVKTHLRSANMPSLQLVVATTTSSKGGSLSLSLKNAAPLDYFLLREWCHYLWESSTLTDIPSSVKMHLRSASMPFLQLAATTTSTSSKDGRSNWKSAAPLDCSLSR